MNNIQKLAQMGVGSEIINCQIERSKIAAALWNAKADFKYLKYAKKSGLCNEEQVKGAKMKTISRLNDVLPLVEKFSELYLTEFREILHKLVFKL